jgi:hypothetical protein
VYDAVLTKDPNAVIDFSRDWSPWLGTDTIATSTWVVATGLTAVTTTYDDTSTTVWLSGGTANTDYEATNRITTDGGRTADRTWLIQVRER